MWRDRRHPMNSGGCSLCRRIQGQVGVRPDVDAGLVDPVRVSAKS
jgi:hypothetical protein